MNFDDEVMRVKREAAMAKLRAMGPDHPHIRKHPDWDKMPTYVVVSALPDEVLFQVVRDPSSNTPRMIVLAENTITDARLYAGLSLLIIDERLNATTESLRVLSQFEGGRYEIVVNGVSTQRHVTRTDNGAALANGKRGSESRKVLREAAKAPLDEITPGLFGRKYQPVK